MAIMRFEMKFIHLRIRFVRITIILVVLFTSFLLGQTNERTSALEKGYRLIATDPVGAIEEFRLAQHLAPSDTIALQIAYLLNRVGLTEEAIHAFTQLTTSSVLEFRERAHSALIVIDNIRRAQRSPLWLHLSAAVFNDSRFHDGILWSTLQGGYHLDEAHTLSAVATIGLNADTRSVGGQLPVLYSDNVLFLTTGLRYSPITGAALDIEGGLAYDLRTQGTRNSLRGDFRAVGSYGTGIYPTPTITEKLHIKETIFTDAGVSVGYYSRYDNCIGYAQGRTGVRFIEYGASALDAYLSINLAMDSRHSFYNNIAEAGGGVRFVPDHRWGVDVLLEFLRGAYIGGSRFQAPGGYYYSTVRFMVLVDRFF
jgi:hypothetical protein